MINSRTIWTFAIGLSILAHIVVFALFYEGGRSYGDDGYLEVELSLEEPKRDQQTQTKQALPAPPRQGVMPPIPEPTELIPMDIDLTPTIDISPEDLLDLPEISLDVQNLNDSFDPLGDSNNIFFGTGPTDESARKKGKESVESNYLKRVSARIHRFKRYPREARIAKQEGTVVMQLTLDSEGKVQDKNITSSSGIDLLDEAALQIITKADPFPKFPSALVKRVGTQLKFSTAINYKLSDAE
ncbi:MAG: energy transducer TonB [Gammaproteobacteria bacterium]|nr:energy transducer TonB [Gammaproteobacteria bacterium]